MATEREPLPTFFIGRNKSGFYAIDLDKSEFLGVALATEAEAIALTRDNRYRTSKKTINNTATLTDQLLELSLKNRPKKEQRRLMRLAKKRDKKLKAGKEAATTARNARNSVKLPKIGVVESKKHKSPIRQKVSKKTVRKKAKIQKIRKKQPKVIQKLLL